VGVVSAGEMGSGVGTLLARAGVRVVTYVEDRSERTRRRAAGAGMEALGSLAKVGAASELVLSLVPPARALELARALAGCPAVFVDCTPASPATVREIAAVIGPRFEDAGIIRGPDAPRVYAAGPGGLFVSDNAGRGWRRRPGRPPSAGKPSERSIRNSFCETTLLRRQSSERKQATSAKSRDCMRFCGARSTSSRKTTPMPHRRRTGQKPSR